MASDSSCIFCKIIKGEIPSLKIIETPLSYSFFDIQPTARGHILIIPKYHGAKLHNLPDENLADILPIAKKIAIASGLDIDSPEGTGYNILQNNGRIAHQVVDHVHFHLIPKRDTKTGLVVGWPAEDADFGDLKAQQQEILTKLKESGLISEN
ncbi:hypothetical protein PACTADRAFT_184987 [Pachysolen tannophilus NRRL Y-2460]|uniref:HIT domain-containing protein n=1 Tax=Pachysolen tannophilus NRRL Y-2460 TaxID=669874 RepID=A0A1E4U399_PACTA|nr:hypothetical protein PACTADRAFT_184987 [Pachysolen tannophilus NRRL Y-2460]